MSYTHVWDDATPLGSAAANTIDDIFRAVKLDIEQRISDLHGIIDFTSDPLETQYIRVGYGTSTKGGFIKYTDDTGAYRWYTGIGNASGAGAATKDFIVYDVVNSTFRLRIDNSTGILYLSNGANVTGSIAAYVANSTTTAFQATVTGDANARFVVGGGGDLNWGNGTLVTDTNLYRASANVLETDDSFVVGGTLTIAGVTTFHNNVNLVASNIVTSGGAGVSGDWPISGDCIIGGGLAVANTATFSTINASANSASPVVEILQTNAVNGYGLVVRSDGTSATRYALRATNLAGDIIYFTVQTETGRVGYVGIGIDTPATQLHVASTFRVDGLATFGNQINLVATGSIGTAVNGEWYLNSNNVARWIVQASGHFVANASNVYDLGATLHLIRTGYFGTSVISPSFVGNLTGNASTATALQTARTINGVSFDGTANITITSAAVSTLTFGTHLTGTSYDGSAPVTIATDATNANTASTIVARDGSGNFIAGTITAALTGNASTTTALQTARTINGTSFDGTSNITITAAAGTLTGTTLNATVVTSSLTTVGTLGSLGVIGNVTAGSFTGNLTGTVTGNASTATALQTARNINGVAFDGTGNITVTAAAGTLTGTTLNTTVVTSSLTTVGTLGSLAVTAGVTAASFTGPLTGNASTATALQTARNINGVAFDGTGNITVTAAASTLTGTTLAALNGSALTNLTGANVVGAVPTATALATARNINGVAFDGTGNITVTADANTLTNTTLKSTVVTSSLTSVGTLGTLTVSGGLTAGAVTSAFHFGNGSTPSLTEVSGGTTTFNTFSISGTALSGKITINFSSINTFIGRLTFGSFGNPVYLQLTPLTVLTETAFRPVGIATTATTIDFAFAGSPATATAYVIHYAISGE